MGWKARVSQRTADPTQAAVLLAPSQEEPRSGDSPGVRLDLNLAVPLVLQRAARLASRQVLRQVSRWASRWASSSGVARHLRDAGVQAGERLVFLRSASMKGAAREVGRKVGREAVRVGQSVRAAVLLAALLVVLPAVLAVGCPVSPEVELLAWMRGASVVRSVPRLEGLSGVLSGEATMAKAEAVARLIAPDAKVGLQEAALSAGLAQTGALRAVVVLRVELVLALRVELVLAPPHVPSRLGFARPDAMVEGLHPVLRREVSCLARRRAVQAMRLLQVLLQQACAARVVGAPHRAMERPDFGAESRTKDLAGRCRSRARGRVA